MFVNVVVVLLSIIVCIAYTNGICTLLICYSLGCYVTDVGRIIGKVYTRKGFTMGGISIT
jgi:hypothetical protein